MAIIMKKRRAGALNSSASSKQPYDLSSHLQPYTTAQVHALEALLRNPIKFIPATHKTRQDEKKMANTANYETSIWKADTDAEADHHRTVLRYLSRSWEYFFKIQPGLRSQGLDNPGPVCYRNSAVQVLMHVPIFLNWLEEDHHPNDCQKKQCLACQLRRLKRAYWESYPSQTQHNKAITNAYNEIHKSAKRLGWKEPKKQQHDVRDFLLWMLAWLRGQLPQDQIDAINAMFGIVTDIKVQCRTCKTTRVLVRPVEPELIQLAELEGLKNGTSLADVIKRTFFNNREVNCEKPGCTDKASKPAEEFITIPPEVIVIALNRFRQKSTNPKDIDLHKDRTKISLSEWLNLQEHYGHPDLPRDTKLAYRLSSVIYHTGELTSGHYVTVARGPPSNWWRINDTVVESASSKMALDYPAEDRNEPWVPYILTYVRTEPRKALKAGG